MDNNRLNIKDWALEDRPREKLLLKGSFSLSNAELIAILIGSGNKNETAVEVSQKILINVGNSLNKLGKQTINNLQKVKGIGEAKAITIIAAMELGRRRKLSEIEDKPQITSCKDVFDFFHSILADLPHEEFWILLLNRSNKIIERKMISQGGIAGTVIDVKLILKHAIDRLASSIIICHNHPSGNLTPSKADMDITQKLQNATAFVDIKLLDHIIVTEKNFYSFAENGKLE